MYHWIRSYFHDRINYNEVAFLIDLLGWGGIFSGIFGQENSGKKELKIARFTVKK